MKAALLMLATMLTLVTACARQERAREIDWAKAALARNPAYEIVATDETAGVFTVRDTATGSVLVLKLEELIAAPRPAKSALKAAAPEEPVEAASTATDTAAAASAAATADNSGTTTLAAGQTTDEARPESPADGVALASGPGYRIERAVDATSKEPAATLEGPGFSITRHDAASGPSAREAEAIAANVEARSDPIICQGERLMRIDGETLHFSGDALIAEAGCDLFITNANISAGGIGIIARRARVHIVNSTIDGKLASYEASDGAELYLTRTTFTGIGRRFDDADVTDLGGNKFESN
jgi:hypothetical protein